MDLLKKLYKHVENTLDAELSSPYSSIAIKAATTSSEDAFQHIVNIGSSVLMTKYPELGGYPGGSFVQAIVDNDLEQAFARADSTNKLAIEFYVKLIQNFSPRYLQD